MDLTFEEKVTVMTALSFYLNELKKYPKSPIVPVEIKTTNNLLKKVADQVTKEVQKND